MYCQVIVDIAHENVAHTFTYAIPEGMSLLPGQRVEVPFGRGRQEGVVLGVSESTDFDPARVKKVIRPLEEYAAVLPPLLELAREMAERVHCPLAETLRLMMPAEMRKQRVRVKTERTARLAVSREKAEAALAGEKRSPKRRALLEILLDGEEHRVRELGEQVRDPGDALKKLEGDGLITLGEAEILRRPGESFGAGEEGWHELTEGQQEVLEDILPALESHSGAFLLHGVTGSGKTEVFMNAVRRVLQTGRSAIILVPEIALTPQMVSWFRDRFGPVAAVIHSRLSAGERYDEWRRIRRGEARVVIGARSAVFAPTESLGLIVVDEEHENTYISDHHPRYDAREVAQSRCEREGATLILASATPSVLSFARARRGDYRLLEMPSRVGNRSLPEVDIVDMRQELEAGNRSVLSGALQRGLTACVREGGQAMLLMNRRGYHSFVSCRKCGYVVKCPHCDVSMTYHLMNSDGKLRCHYCGEVMDLPETCPSCHSRYIKFFGAGTQKVEEEVRKLLPGVNVVRMDVDTTGGKDGHGKVLEEFRSGRARVMIGTQMIAKGLDFPQVTLVGVVAADLTLNLPDYRSRERTFQLLTQVAGRAGRGRRPGHVIIQTYHPEDEIIGFAARQDYRAFFENEFQRRRRALYPPFTVMARLLAEAPTEEAAERCVLQMEQEARKLVEAHPAWQRKVLRMAADTPPFSMLRGRYRRHIVFRLLVSPETEALCGELTELADRDWGQAEVCFEYNPTMMM